MSLSVTRTRMELESWRKEVQPKCEKTRKWQRCKTTHVHMCMLNIMYFSQVHMGMCGRREKENVKNGHACK